MPSKLLVVNDAMFIGTIRRLMERGEISVAQYACCLRRYKASLERGGLNENNKI